MRARRLLATLEADLGPGFGAALARSADLLREDADYLETLAMRARAQLPEAAGAPGVDLEALAALPRAIRTRVWRLLAAEAGAPLADVSARTSSRSTPCSPRGTDRVRCTCPAASPSPAPAGVIRFAPVHATASA